jgi:hypothetical protein
MVSAISVAAMLKYMDLLVSLVYTQDDAEMLIPCILSTVCDSNLKINNNQACQTG